MQVSLIATADQMCALQHEWMQLFYASATSNPFAHPLWMTSWARHFLKPSQLYLITVRGNDGALIGVAPFYRRHYRLGPAVQVTAIQLFAAAEHMDLTELTQVLIRPGSERPVLRAIMGYLGEHAADWDWIEIVLPPEQGWFEPHWLPERGPGAGSFVVHKATRPCVHLPLPDSWEELRAGLKRNVKESLRHGVNSLKRAGYAWYCTTPDGSAALAPALEALRTLHQARADVREKVHHPDYLADERERSFLLDVAGPMFAAGHLTPVLLHAEGKAAAARLLLHANGATFFSLSGFDPQWWSYNVATTLMAECLRLAIGRGDSLANLSPGVDVAKLRWSERLDLYQEFVVVGSRRRSRLAFSLFWQARAAAVLRREWRRHWRA